MEIFRKIIKKNDDKTKQDITVLYFILTGIYISTQVK